VSEGELARVSCATCGTTFGMTPTLYGFRKKDGEGFFCPNGHSVRFTRPAPTVDPRDAELTKLRSEVGSLTKDIARLTKENDALRTELELWKPREALERPAEKDEVA